MNKLKVALGTMKSVSQPIEMIPPNKNMTAPARDSLRPALPCPALPHRARRSLALSLRSAPPHGFQKITDGTVRFAQYELLEWSTRVVGGPCRIRFAERSDDTSPTAAEWHDWVDRTDRTVWAPAD